MLVLREGDIVKLNSFTKRRLEKKRLKKLNPTGQSPPEPTRKMTEEEKLLSVERAKQANLERLEVLKRHAEENKKP